MLSYTCGNELSQSQPSKNVIFKPYTTQLQKNSTYVCTSMDVS